MSASRLASKLFVLLNRCDVFIQLEVTRALERETEATLEGVKIRAQAEVGNETRPAIRQRWQGVIDAADQELARRKRASRYTWERGDVIVQLPLPKEPHS